jgi:hypothetical protein
MPRRPGDAGRGRAQAARGAAQFAGHDRVMALARGELLGVDSKARHSAPMMPGPEPTDTSGGAPTRSQPPRNGSGRAAGVLGEDIPNSKEVLR